MSGDGKLSKSSVSGFGISGALLFDVTLKIVRRTEDGTTILKLSGRIRSEDLGEVRRQMDEPGMWVAFDLKEVTLVDLDSVRFLGLCESEGASLLNCPLYIREWILRERHLETKSRRGMNEGRNG